MSRLVITMPASATTPRVRVDACPHCYRPLVLDHAGVIDDDGDQCVDLTLIGTAQRLHEAQCTG